MIKPFGINLQERATYLLNLDVDSVKSRLIVGGGKVVRSGYGSSCVYTEKCKRRVSRYL